jgi:hypothetical protein
MTTIDQIISALDNNDKDALSNLLGILMEPSTIFCVSEPGWSQDEPR